MVGLGADRRWDRSCIEEDTVSTSPAEATSLARTEEMWCSFVWSPPFSLARAESYVEMVSSWLVIAMIPETVANKMDSVDPSLAKMA